MKKILGILSFVFIFQTAAHADFLEKKQAAIGKPVADFTLEDLTGKPTSLSEFRGKPVVVHFWSAKCPFVKRYEQRLQAITKEYADKNVAVIAIHSNVNEKDDLVKQVAQERGVNYPILMDPDHKVADYFGAITTPHVYIVDPQGNLVYEGAVDDEGWKEGSPVQNDYIRHALDEILAGKPVSKSTTKTFGCTIKRASS